MRCDAYQAKGSGMGSRARTARTAGAGAVKVFEFTAFGCRFRGTPDQLQAQLMYRANGESTTVSVLCARILREAGLRDESAPVASLGSMLSLLVANDMATVYTSRPSQAPRRRVGVQR